MLAKFSFVHLVAGILVLAFIAGIALFVVWGGTTSRGTTGAIAAEYREIVAAENKSCDRYGRYSRVARLRSEGLLSFRPVYNSVVYLPGKGCGTIVVGSSAYQPSAR